MLTPTKIKAILAAADHIENNPNSYCYINGMVAKTKYDHVCSIGWIGYFLGYKSSETYLTICSDIFGHEYSWFVANMDAIHSNWRCDARQAASALRVLIESLSTHCSPKHGEFKPLKDFI